MSQGQSYHIGEGTFRGAGASNQVEGTMNTGIYTMQGDIERALPRELLRKCDLTFGDLVIVRTKNSTYSISVLGDDLYLVFGGWFERKGISPQTTKINGCTWGGSAIKQDIVAARGLFLEFENHVLTTRIQDFRVIHRAPQRYPN